MLTQRVAARIKHTAPTAHKGWKTTSVLTDGDVLHFKYPGTGLPYSLHIGVGEHTGTPWVQDTYSHYVINYVNSTTIDFYADGVLSTLTVAGFSSNWCNITRNGTSYELWHLNDLIHTWVDATDYNAGGQGYVADGTQQHTVEDSWAVTGTEGGTIVEGNVVYELLQPAAGGVPFNGVRGGIKTT